MSHNIDLNVMNMRTDLAIDEVNNEELEKLKEEKENGNEKKDNSKKSYY